MNILRILALAVIIGYHFLADIYQRGLCEIQHPDVHMVIGNINLVMVSVGIFFILSGCGLTLAVSRNGQENRWSVYYKGRFLKILVPFYVVYIAYLVYKLITAESPLFEGVQWWKFIFTVLGIDEYLHMAGVSTFSLGIGEWFLGAIIMMYAVFPLLYTVMKKWKWQTIAIATVYYIVVILTYNSDIAWYNNVFVKIYDFVVGMFLALELCEPHASGFKSRIRPAVLLPALIVVTAAFAAIKLHPAFSNILVCTGIFLIGFYLEAVIGDISFISRFAAKLCSYEYFVFLVHHCVIYLYHEPMQKARMIISKPRMIALFGIELVTMILLAMAVRWISKLPVIKVKKKAA